MLHSNQPDVRFPNKTDQQPCWLAFFHLFGQFIEILKSPECPELFVHQKASTTFFQGRKTVLQNHHGELLLAALIHLKYSKKDNQVVFKTG